MRQQHVGFREESVLITEDPRQRLLQMKSQKFVVPYCDVKGHESDRLLKICCDTHCPYYLIPYCQQCQIDYDHHQYCKQILLLRDSIRLIGEKLSTVRENKQREVVKVKKFQMDQLENLAKNFDSLRDTLSKISSGILKKMEQIRQMTILHPEQESKHILNDLLECKTGDSFKNTFEKMRNFVKISYYEPEDQQFTFKEKLDLDDWDVDNSVDIYSHNLTKHFEDLSRQLSVCTEYVNQGFQKMYYRKEISEYDAEMNAELLERLIAKQEKEKAELQKVKQQRKDYQELLISNGGQFSIQTVDLNLQDVTLNNKKTEDLKTINWEFLKQKTRYNDIHECVKGLEYEGAPNREGNLQDVIISSQSFSSGVHCMQIEIVEFGERKGSLVLGIILDAYSDKKAPVLQYGCSKCLFTNNESQMYKAQERLESNKNQHKEQANHELFFEMTPDIVQLKNVIIAVLNFEHSKFSIVINNSKGNVIYESKPEHFEIEGNSFRFAVWWRESSKCKIRLLKSY